MMNVSDMRVLASCVDTGLAPENLVGWLVKTQ